MNSVNPLGFVEDPADPDLLEGLEAYDAKQWSLAEKPLRKAAERGNITAIFKLANVVHHLSRTAEAIELWELASAQGHDGAANNLAVWLKQQGRIDEAAALHKQSALTGNVEAMFNLGVILDEMGHHVEARAWFEQAIEGGYGRAAASLGRSLIVRGNREEGVSILESGVDLGSLSAALMLAVDAQERSDFSAVIDWSSRALAMSDDPNEAHQMPHALGLLGFGLRMTGRYCEAIEPLERAVAMGDTDAEPILDNVRHLCAKMTSQASQI